MSDSDRKNVELILATIGVLVAVAVVLFVIARGVNNEMQASMASKDTMVQAAVNKRIAPAGRVIVEGEEDDSESVEAVADVEEAPVVLTGPQVYNAACVACHGSGAGGAPMTGDKAAWADRLAKGRDALNYSALNGIGIMPAKGGRLDLSDEEIIAAVGYLVEQVQ